MDRILIVEENKALANLLSKKISDSLDYAVDIAYSFNEAKLFLRQYQYFLTLISVSSSTPIDGGAVDYALAKGQKVIVLSTNMDKDFREKTLQKNILDYVRNSGAEDIRYVIQSVQRLKKNKEHRVLLVDDSLVIRKQMQTLLQNLNFKVIAVAHGEEALGMLKTHDDFSLVITDYNMPVMDGLELTKEIRAMHDKKRLPIIVLSSDNDDSTIAQFLKKGANDYIKKPFSKEEFSCRINNSIETLEYIKLITDYEVKFDDL